MHKHVDTLLQKEMTRKEFLASIGLGMASIMGFSTIIHLLTGKSVESHFGSTSRGYGSLAYGGSRER